MSRSSVIVCIHGCPVAMFGRKKVLCLPETVAHVHKKSLISHFFHVLNWCIEAKRFIVQLFQLERVRYIIKQIRIFSG